MTVMRACLLSALFLVMLAVGYSFGEVDGARRAIAERETIEE